MIRLIVEKEMQDLLYSNILNESHSKTRLKSLVVYLKSFDIKHKEICQICRITKPTLTEYLAEFKDHGIDSFKSLKWKGQSSKLNDYKEMIDQAFEKEPPQSINEAGDRIEQLTGIKRSPTQIRMFLKKLKYKHLKTGSIPGNGDGQDESREEEREGFKKNNWSRVWKKQ
jgi:transposase